MVFIRDKQLERIFKKKHNVSVPAMTEWNLTYLPTLNN